MNIYKLQEIVQACKVGEGVDLQTMGQHFEHLVEIARLADIINMEFKSDPMSVQCFDLRIVDELNDALTLLEVA